MNQARVQHNPFNLECLTHDWQAGDTLADIVLSTNQSPAMLKTATITIDGIIMRQEYWHVIRPKPGTMVLVKLMPGDSSILRAAAFIGLAVTVPWAATVIGTSAGFSATAGYALSAGLFALGSVAINALIPPAVPKVENGDSVSQTLSITASRNRVAPFGTMIRPYGTNRIYPPYAAKPYTELQGDEQYVRMLFVVGYKPMAVDETTIKLGDTLLSNFSDVDPIEFDCGTPGQDGGISLFPAVVDEVAVNTKLGPTPQNWTIRTSAPDADQLGFDVSLPQGLIRIDRSGDDRPVEVGIEWDYRLTDSGDAWTTGGSKNFWGESATAIRWGRLWNVPRGQYDIRMRRTSNDADTSGGDSVYNDDVWWSVLRTFTNGNPVNDPDAALMAIRIRASDQLNGTPDQVNLIGTAWLPDWNGVDGWDSGPTNNPASAMRSILTGPENARALPESRLDAQAWQDFHDYCAAEGWAYNQVIDSNTTIADGYQTAGATARARIVQTDGKWSVIWDRLLTAADKANPPVYSPRNSYGFNGSKLYPEDIHAFRVRFINELNGLYENDERLVYADGYDAGNATKFEALELTGVTDANLIYKHARYYLGVAILQPESFAFSLDAENLVCLPGDYIEYQQDAILVGSGAARVKAFDATTVTLDGQIELGANSNGIQFRASTGAVGIEPVDEVSVFTDTFTFTNVPTATFAIGDLAVVGEVGRITQPLQVKNIRPNADLSASLECVPYFDALYTSDTQTIPPYDPHITQPPGLYVPVISQIVSDESVLFRDTAGNYQARAVLTLGFPQNREGVSGVLVQYRIQQQSTYQTNPWVDMAVQPYDSVQVSVESVTEGLSYEFRAKYNFLSGESGLFSEIIPHTIVGKTSPPPDLDFLSVTVGPDGTRYFDFGWDDPATEPPDLAGFQIRYADASLPNYLELSDGIDRLELENGTDLLLVQDTLQTIPPAWESMTPLKPVGIITESPYESGSAPWEGPYNICAAAVDSGGRISTERVCVFKELPLPRVGDTVVFRSDFNNVFGTADQPQTSEFLNCQYASGSGFVVPDDGSRWDDGAGGPRTWADEPLWASNPAASMTFTSILFVGLPTTELSWSLDVTFDASGGATITADVNVDGAGWTLDVPLVGHLTTGTQVQWRFTITNPGLDGIEEITYQGFDATGAVTVTNETTPGSTADNYVRITV